MVPIFELLDETEVLMVVKIEDESYEVLMPDELPEAFYLRFLNARALIAENTEKREKEGITQTQDAYCEGQVLNGLRQWVEAVSQMPNATLYHKPAKIVGKLYRQISERMVTRQGEAEGAKEQAPEKS